MTKRLISDTRPLCKLGSVKKRRIIVLVSNRAWKGVFCDRVSRCELIAQTKKKALVLDKDGHKYNINKKYIRWIQRKPVNIMNRGRIWHI